TNDLQPSRTSSTERSLQIVCKFCRPFGLCLANIPTTLGIIRRPGRRGRERKRFGLSLTTGPQQDPNCRWRFRSAPRDIISDGSLALCQTEVSGRRNVRPRAHTVSRVSSRLGGSCPSSGVLMFGGGRCEDPASPRTCVGPKETNGRLPTVRRRA